MQAFANSPPKREIRAETLEASPRHEPHIESHNLRLQNSPPVSVMPMASMIARVIMPVWPVHIGIAAVTNRRMSAAHRFAVAVAVSGCVGAKIWQALRE